MPIRKPPRNPPPPLPLVPWTPDPSDHPDPIPVPPPRLSYLWQPRRQPDPGTCATLALAMQLLHGDQPCIFHPDATSRSHQWYRDIPRIDAVHTRIIPATTGHNPPDAVVRAIDVELDLSPKHPRPATRVILTAHVAFVAIPGKRRFRICKTRFASIPAADLATAFHRLWHQRTARQTSAERPALSRADAATRVQRLY